MSVSYTRLPSGAWGLRSDKRLESGLIVGVQKRSGDITREVVGAQVSAGAGWYTYYIATARAMSSRTKPRYTTHRNRPVQAKRTLQADGAFADPDPEGWTRLHSDAPFTVGTTLSIGGDKWGTVVAWREAIHTQYTNDTREGEHYFVAQCRPATEEEATAAAKARADKLARKERSDKVTALLVAAYRSENYIGDTPPQGVTEIWADRRDAGSITWYVDGAGIVYRGSSSYDDMPRYWKTDVSAELVEEAKSLGIRVV